jgi:hypothetical protein
LTINDSTVSANRTKKEEIMRAGYPADLLGLVLLPRRASPFFCVAIVLGMLLLVGPAFAQLDSQSEPTGSKPEGVADSPSADSSSSQSRPITSYPNAPSTTKADAVPVGSLTLGDRFTIYRRQIFRPYSLLGPALGAGVGQWEDQPPEWGPGSEGYARRFASGVGRNLISETIRFGVAAADGEDPRYHRSQDTGVWKRTKHVVAETFTSETAGGSRIPAYSRFAGTYGAAFIANAWYPDSQATAGWALRRGSTALASSLGFHLFEEFMPRKYFKALHLGD